MPDASGLVGTKQAELWAIARAAGLRPDPPGLVGVEQGGEGGVASGASRASLAALPYLHDRARARRDSSPNLTLADDEALANQAVVPRCGGWSHAVGFWIAQDLGRVHQPASPE